MKILTNREYKIMKEENNFLRNEVDRWRKEYMEAHESYLRELNELYEIKETKLLANKYDYIICCKDYNCSIYVDGKREKKVKAAHFDVSASEVPVFSITR